jgi:hypothetical protein
MEIIASVISANNHCIHEGNWEKKILWESFWYYHIKEKQVSYSVPVREIINVTEDL